MNNLMCVGRLTKEPELRYTQENKPVCMVNIAINNGKDDTTFLSITIFGKMAESTHQYCHKGDILGIQGLIRNHNWTDKDGKNHYDYSFIANKVTFLSTKPSSTKEEVQEKTKIETKKLADDVFSDFGSSIEISDEDLAF